MCQSRSSSTSEAPITCWTALRLSQPRHIMWMASEASVMSWTAPRLSQGCVPGVWELLQPWAPELGQLRSSGPPTAHSVYQA